MAAVLDDAPRGLVLEDHGLSESTAVDEEQPAARSSAGPRLPGSDAKERMNRTLLLAAGTAALGGMLFGCVLLSRFSPPLPTCRLSCCGRSAAMRCM